MHFVGLFFSSIMKMHGPKTKTINWFKCLLFTGWSIGPKNILCSVTVLHIVPHSRWR